MAEQVIADVAPATNGLSPLEQMTFQNINQELTILNLQMSNLQHQANQLQAQSQATFQRRVKFIVEMKAAYPGLDFDPTVNNGTGAFVPKPPAQEPAKE